MLLCWSAIVASCILSLTRGAIVRTFRCLHSVEEVGGVRYNISINKKDCPKQSFQPSEERCCQIGLRVAKKKMSCDITMLALLRKYERDNESANRPVKLKKRGRLDKLSDKISRCSAKFPKHFNKCCTKKQDFIKHMKACGFKPPQQRWKCKQMIRKKYSSTS
ncbi:uncharacterized protein LOC131948319 [Physella acuta]|uniref:uncharacterized protein LOC131948319 n=1 Tax=Physella acuta TaxID=109671 RepID=UPI0027DAD013|nr:uncharacterized protein LOC131948319 [Physella acuta]XP_059165879.1 uncharacterized protein LOC131948319 [Physella acuta]